MVFFQVLEELLTVHQPSSQHTHTQTHTSYFPTLTAFSSASIQYLRSWIPDPFTLHLEVLKTLNKRSTRTHTHTCARTRKWDQLGGGRGSANESLVFRCQSFSILVWKWRGTHESNRHLRCFIWKVTLHKYQLFIRCTNIFVLTSPSGWNYIRKIKAVFTRGMFLLLIGSRIKGFPLEPRE